jgi:uncharacterized protein (DUF362 family)
MRRDFFKDIKAAKKPASDIFLVNGPTAGSEGFNKLINSMAARGLLFYRSSQAGAASGPAGLIGPGDTVIIKVNSQWAERGGTNTDLVKSIIQAITAHPGGFKGEVVIADNGQAQYGTTGKGGWLDYPQNNAEDTAQSNQKVADSFSGFKVSTYLWDNITTTRAKEYSEGDLNDGYVCEDCLNVKNGFMLSYPKFTTRFGTRISLKQGVWDPKSGKYNSASLKFINVPVLKSHFIYGVTGCVKHYMGVVSDKLTAQFGARSHQLVGVGGMGSEMVGTRYPVLNVLDAIWINAKPKGGPMTPYPAATRTDVVFAGLDPVALDHWAAKNLLMKVAAEAGHQDLSTIDPDFSQGNSFGAWLRLASQEIKSAGKQATYDPEQMNVYVTEL